MTARPQTSSAYTLLEMLLVLAVLGIVVVGSFNHSEINIRSIQFDLNDARLTAVREAILGSPEAQLEEHLLISGFAADLGRLPNTISELLRPESLPLWAYDEATDQWSGWRGPYLHTFALQEGLSAYPDSWGNLGDTDSFGWNLSVDQTEGTLFLQSYGADGVPGGTGYDSDYPQSALLIQRGEALVDIVGWQVTVHFYNPEGGPSGGIALPSADTRVRVRLHYPDSGNMSWPPTWPATEGERDQANYLSEDIILAAGVVADNAVSSMVMSFGSETKRAPFGVRSVSVVDDTDGTRIGDPAQPAWRVELVSQLQPRPTAIAWNLE